MGNFLRKGRRKYENAVKKHIEKEGMQLLTKTFDAMNSTFNTLKDDPELRDSNFLKKVKAVSSFPFNKKQLNLLRKDLMLTVDE